MCNIPRRRCTAQHWQHKRPRTNGSAEASPHRCSSVAGRPCRARVQAQPLDSSPTICGGRLPHRGPDLTLLSRQHAVQTTGIPASRTTEVKCRVCNPADLDLVDDGHVHVAAQVRHLDGARQVPRPRHLLPLLPCSTAARKFELQRYSSMLKSGRASCTLRMKAAHHRTEHVMQADAAVCWRQPSGAPVMRLQKVPPALQVSATSMASSRSGAQYSPSPAPRIACAPTPQLM